MAEEGDPPDVFHTLEAFHLVAVRFDLCDRTMPGQCPHGSDGRIRAVFQPIVQGMADDVALHAFYMVPNAELPSLITELRELARLQGEPRTSPVKVSPALAREPGGGYAEGLRALRRRRTGANLLTRLTFFALPSLFAQGRWSMRGIELRDGGFVRVGIPAAGSEPTQIVTFYLIEVVDQRARCEAWTFDAATARLTAQRTRGATTGTDAMSLTRTGDRLVAHGFAHTTADSYAQG